MSPDYSALRLEVGDGVAEITLSRPEVLNAADETLHRELLDVLLEVASRDDVRAVVLAAEGKVFSAGGDFELMRRANADVGARRAVVDEGRRLVDALIDVPQPIVAALEGSAYGLGATIVAGCDAVVAHEGVALADPHVVVGLVAGDGGCLFWPQSAGMLRARRHLLTGDPLSARDALACGMVTDLVERDDVLPTARAIAARIAALAPLAVQGTKRSLNRVSQLRAAEVIPASFAAEERTLASADLVEALAAWEERRPGRYEGR